MSYLIDLKKSPIFNLSLSSKELFHSNFIAWVVETYPEEMGGLFAEKFNIKTDSLNITNLYREKNNIDIAFKIGSIPVYIENKVKSLPYKAQLDKYAELKDIKNDDTAVLVLLSMRRPTFFNHNIYKFNNKKWLYVGYEELLEVLGKLTNEIALKHLQDSKNCHKQHNGLNHFYNHFLIKDYIGFVEKVLKILERVGTVNLINLYNKETDDAKQLVGLRDIRMHDLFQKAVFEDVAIKIYKSLKKRENINVKNIDLQNEDEEINCVNVHYGMTRATGLLHVSYKHSKDLSVAVQIQGNMYKKVIYGQDEINILNASLKIYDQLSNFPKSLQDGKVRPDKDNTALKNLSLSLGMKNTENLRFDFNKYHTSAKNHLFLYKYIKLGESSKTNDDLVRVICEDFENMVKSIKDGA
jgi:hypothetical protein